MVTTVPSVVVQNFGTLIGDEEDYIEEEDEGDE